MLSITEADELGGGRGRGRVANPVMGEREWGEKPGYP